MSEYSDFKHDFRTDYETGDQSRGMFHLDDLGPSFKDDPMFALRVSLALATIEAELYPTLNDGENYMFYHTYENVDRIIVGVHVETQEELDEMKRDRDFVLIRDEQVIMEELEYYREVRNDVYQEMDSQKDTPHLMFYGSSYVFSDEMLGENRELEYFMCLCYVACGLYELEHYHGIEPIIEMYMTYYIYQYEHFGKYKDMLYDYELLEKDIEKIKSMRKLKFERLKCYEESTD